MWATPYTTKEEAASIKKFYAYMSEKGYVEKEDYKFLCEELKDITRFNNIKQINASCGLDPTIVQSGKSIDYHGPISKRGNRYARKILFNCSRNIVTLSAKCDKENPIYVYYQKKNGCVNNSV